MTFDEIVEGLSEAAAVGPHYVRGVRPDGEVYWTAYTRMRFFPDGGPSCELVLFGPKPAGHPGLVARSCPGCGAQFREGDLTTLVPIGPGLDPGAREKAASGRWFSGVALEVHWACATGAEIENVTSAPPPRSREEKT